MTELSARLQQLHNAGTQGPWVVNSETGGGEFGDYTVYGIKDVASASWCPDSASSFAYCEGMEEADAELIVALRNNTPEIIAALEAVERVRELHVPTEQEVIAWSCVYGECEESHPDECPILTITTCAECSRLVFEETDEPGNVPTFPCPTIRALGGE